MQRYVIISGVLFTFISATWLIRWMTGVAVVVGSINVPLWFSVIPMAATGSLAVWAFRLAAKAQGSRPTS